MSEMIGIYNKYIVSKVAGPMEPGAEYFVLRIDSDPHARAAIKAYAQSIQKENPNLAFDLLRKVAKHITRVCAQHVKGHSNDAWDECADRLCEHILNHREHSQCNVNKFIADCLPVPFSHGFSGNYGQHQRADWSFLWFLSEQERVRYPPADQSGESVVFSLEHLQNSLLGNL